MPKKFIPNIFTLINMFLGFLSIALIINNEPIKAGGFILIAGIFDVFDGKIARILGLESDALEEMSGAGGAAGAIGVPKRKPKNTMTKENKDLVTVDEVMKLIMERGILR